MNIIYIFTKFAYTRRQRRISPINKVSSTCLQRPVFQGRQTFAVMFFFFIFLLRISGDYNNYYTSVIQFCVPYILFYCSVRLLFLNITSMTRAPYTDAVLVISISRHYNSTDSVNNKRKFRRNEMIIYSHKKAVIFSFLFFYFGARGGGTARRDRKQKNITVELTNNINNRRSLFISCGFTRIDFTITIYHNES